MTRDDDSITDFDTLTYVGIFITEIRLIWLLNTFFQSLRNFSLFCSRLCSRGPPESRGRGSGEGCLSGSREGASGSAASWARAIPCVCLRKTRGV
jgi:hypothetical protein